MIDVRIAARTDIGRVRSQNEDAYLTSLPLVAVADGMGGHRAGEVASSMALEVLDRWRGSAESGGADGLREAVLEANHIVWSKGQEDRTLEGMGTTLTAAWIHGSTATLAHVGDSRAYLLREGSLSRLTEDHTLVKQMEAEGRIEPGEADRHPQRNILTQALGVDDQVDVEVLSFELQLGDRLLLATDGLHGQIDDRRICEILSSMADPDAACATLVEEANAAGGEDNVTVVLLDTTTEAAPAAEEAPEKPRTVIVEKPSTGVPVAIVARRRRRRRRLVTILAVVVGVALFAAALFVRSGPRYFIGVAGDRVAVLDGPLGASPPRAKVVRTTQIAITDVPEGDQRKLRRGIPVGSLSEASQIVAGIPRKLGESETTTPSPPPPPPPPSPT